MDGSIAIFIPLFFYAVIITTAIIIIIFLIIKRIKDKKNEHFEKRSS